MGVYARLYDEAASPDKLRQAMKQIKATGIDFIIPYGKGATVNWDSRIAPEELVTKRSYMEQMVKCAHAEGLKVYPQFCVATEGGESGPNAMLKRNPSWAFFYDGARRGYIDPGNADARRYETSLISELVSKYDVDGLSLDYCRCPNRIGYTDTGRAEFLKKHNVDLAKIVSAGPETLETEGGAFGRGCGAREPDLAGMAQVAGRADQYAGARDSRRGEQSKTRPADLQLRLGL
jgi:hypothetical protein